MIRKSAIFIFLLSLPLLASAQLESQFKFTGQNQEAVKIAGPLTIQQPTQVEVPSTCTRQVPHQENVCRDVTRYRQECHNVPSHENCWTDYERVCRPVTRTREECSTGPSRHECHQRPSRQECHTIPSREVCTTRPTHEVCHTDPTGHNHCTTVGGGQSCTQVGGGQSCNTVGGGEECHTIPGDRICRTVTYTDQQCEQVARNRCETVPSHNECQDIPYSVNVCGMETVYTTESYACTETQTVNKPVLVQVTGDVNVQINTNGIVAEFPVKVALKAADELAQNFVMSVSLPEEPKTLVLLKKNEVKVVNLANGILALEGDLGLELIDPKTVQPVFPSRFVDDVLLNARSLKLTAPISGAISATGSIELSVMKGRKSIGELKAAYPGDKVQILKQGRNQSLVMDLKGIVTERLSTDDELTMSVKLIAPLNVPGTVLNTSKPTTEKLYKNVPAFVE